MQITMNNKGINAIEILRTNQLTTNVITTYNEVKK